ncbi:MAG: cyclic-di-AMP receptor [Oscillospiraceae bacterium]|nr:cyclic-di-AMP receptor [Oscillospiraceae bacterium]
MKLVIAIVNKEDSSALVQKLNKSGFMSTKLSTTGGFLRAGNVTLLIGAADERVDEIIGIITDCCSKHTQIINSASVLNAEQYFTSLPVEVTVGGATVFVVDVEKFLKV